MSACVIVFIQHINLMESQPTKKVKLTHSTAFLIKALWGIQLCFIMEKLGQLYWKPQKDRTLSWILWFPFFPIKDHSWDFSDINCKFSTWAFNEVHSWVCIFRRVKISLDIKLSEYQNWIILPKIVSSMACCARIARIRCWQCWAINYTDCSRLDWRVGLATPWHTHYFWIGEAIPPNWGRTFIKYIFNLLCGTKLE